LNIAVIGGGYAGMAAAVVLAEHNIPVTVFESASQLGGRARGVIYNDTQLDNGQHILLGCYHHTLQLIEQVGGNIELDFLRLPLQLNLHQRFALKAPKLPAPLHLLAGLLLAKGLSFTQRLSATRFMLALRRVNFVLPDDISVLDLLNTHQQDQELIRLLWEPICISALNTPVHKASAQVLLNVLRDSLNGVRADSDMLLPRFDFSSLFPNRAAAYLTPRGGKVLTSCGVKALVHHGENIELLTAHGAQFYSHVIIAATPGNAARLLRTLPQLLPIAEQINALSFQPIYTVYLQYPEQVHLPHPMLGLDRCFSQWVFDKGQIAGSHGLIAAVISAEGMHQELDHAHLAQKVAQELHSHMDISAKPLWYQVIAEKRATFSCEPKLVRPAHKTEFDNLFLAGDYTEGDYPATLEGAVISGIRSAKEIVRRNAASIRI
jgi:squalene-associated FAD-dependent desaturase